MAEVLSHTHLDAEQEDFVQTIQDSGKSLLDLLNDILNLSKIEAEKIELEILDVFIPNLLNAAEGL